MVELETALRRNGCRVTAARRAVWEVLGASGDHLSAQEIADRVHSGDPAINLSSIYRALTVFADLGLVRESRLSEDASTWELTHDDGVIHLVCSSCGTVLHHDTALVERIRRDLERSAAFVPDVIDVRVTGHCTTCSADTP